MNVFPKIRGKHEFKVDLFNFKNYKTEFLLQFNSYKSSLQQNYNLYYNASNSKHARVVP